MNNLKKLKEDLESRIDDLQRQLINGSELSKKELERLISLNQHKMRTLQSKMKFAQRYGFM